MKIKNFTATEFLIVVAVVGLIVSFVFRIYANVKTEDDVVYLSFVFIIVSTVYIVVFRLFGDKGLDWLNKLHDIVIYLFITAGIALVIYAIIAGGGYLR